MRSAADIAAEMDEGLQGLFQRGLDLAFRCHEDAVAAETPDARAKLTLTFHRVSRSVRQTAALRMRLAREAERAGREQAADAVKRDAARRETRKARLKAGIARQVWSEYEADDAVAEDILDRLDLVLEAEAGIDGFETADPQAQIAELCRAIGYEFPSPLAGDAVGPAPDPASTQAEPGPPFRASG